MRIGRWAAAALLLALIFTGWAEAFSGSIVGTASVVTFDAGADEVKVVLDNGNWVQFSTGDASTSNVWRKLKHYAKQKKKVIITLKSGEITGVYLPKRIPPPQESKDPATPAVGNTSGKVPA